MIARRKFKYEPRPRPQVFALKAEDKIDAMNLRQATLYLKASPSTLDQVLRGNRSPRVYKDKTGLFCLKADLDAYDRTPLEEIQAETRAFIIAYESRPKERLDTDRAARYVGCGVGELRCQRDHGTGPKSHRDEAGFYYLKEDLDA